MPRILITWISSRCRQSLSLADLYRIVVQLYRISVEIARRLGRRTFLQRDNPRTVFEGQRFCETMRFSNSDFVSISRRAIIRYSSLKRWLGTGTEIAT